jgi:L-threonylcarbamoyladenylate synthase
VILDGGIIVYPTDTLYGFGVDARNKSAIKKLNNIKGRKTPMSVITWSVNVMSSWSNIDGTDFKKVENVLRESNTIIIPVKDNIAHKDILADDGSLGIRMPRHTYPINLCKTLNFPITTTSVNKAGKDPLNDPELIRNQFHDEIDLIIDAGRLPSSKGSSIYKLVNSKLKLIR